MATVKSIAEKLGLSSATVSRALRNDESLSITPETRSRILMTAKEMGYQVKPKKEPKIMIDQTLVVIHKQQTFRNQIDSSYYFAVRLGIEDICAKEHFNCIFVPIEAIASCELNPEGILLVGNYTKSQFDAIVTKFKGIPTATVGIVSYYPEMIDHITYSNHDSVTLALTHLLNNGHSKIGYLGIEEAPGTDVFGSRKQIFKQIMMERGHYHEEWVLESDHGKDRVEQGYLTMKQWISRKQPMPTAIFCANDPIALGAMKALYESEFQIPEDISIIAHDGSYPSQYCYPALTTVDVHPYTLGCESVLTLSERIHTKRRYAKKISLYPELLLRDSVRAYSN